MNKFILVTNYIYHHSYNHSYKFKKSKQRSCLKPYSVIRFILPLWEAIPFSRKKGLGGDIMGFPKWFFSFFFCS